MFEFFTSLFSSSSKYIYEDKDKKTDNVNNEDNEDNEENEVNNNVKLLADLISNTELITGMEVRCEEYNKYYYMYYDWPSYGSGFVLKESENSMDKDGLYIDNGSNTYLFQKILDLCSNFDKFTIIVRNEIKTVNGRKKAYEREPIILEGWKFVEPIILNKYFAVADYTYKRLM